MLLSSYKKNKFGLLTSIFLPFILLVAYTLVMLPKADATTISTVVTSATDVGFYSATKVGTDGFARIAYYDTTDGDLKYIQCTNADCSTKNTATLDTTGDVGSSMDMIIAPNGKAMISYRDATNGKVKFANCNDDACSAPTINTIASSAQVVYTEKISLTLDFDERPRMLYRNSGNSIRQIRCTDVNCAGSVETQVTSSAAFPTIRMGLDGLPRFFFFSTSVGKPYYGVCFNADCNSNTINPTDTGSNTGYFTTFEIGTDGFGRLVYYDQTNGDLRFVQCTNYICTAFTGTNLDSSGTVGATPSITIDENDLARITYYAGAPTNDLKYIQCLNATCSSRTTTVLDTGGDVGTNSFVTLGLDGFPRITYYDTTNTDLKFIQCTSMACDSTFEPSNLYANTSNLGAQNGDTLPNTLKNTNVVFSAVHHDEQGDSADKYELQIATDTAFSALVYDSGGAGTGMSTTLADARSPDITPTGFTPEEGITYYWRIKFWDINNNEGSFPTTYSRFRVQQTPRVTTVDNSKDVGIFNITRVGSDGFARIAYYDYSNKDLKYTQCTNADCTTKNTVVLDSTGDVGSDTGMTIDTNGNAVIAYRDATNDRVKLLRCNDAACSSPTITTITGSTLVGGYRIDVALGLDDLPRMIYARSDSYLFHIRCTNASCSTNVVSQVSGISRVAFPSLAIANDGNSRIAYYNIDVSGRPYYAQCSNINCSSATQVEIEAINYSGYYISLAIGTDGFARLAYYDATSEDVRFSRCTNASCSTKTSVIVDGTGTMGTQTSMVLDRNDFARIAYMSDTPNFDLKYAQCLDMTCTTKTTNLLDTQNAVGYATSITLGLDEFPRISYYDYTNHDVKFAQCTSMACDGTYEPSNLFANTSDLGAQSGEYLPNTLKNTNVVFSAIHHDHEGDSANKYQLQIATDTLFSSLVYDSGASGTTMTTTAVNSRSPDLSPTGFTPTSGTTYYFRIKFWDTNDTVGPYPTVYSRFKVQQATTISRVDTANDVGIYSAVKVAPDGFARIAYYDSFNQDLKYTQCTNTDCTTKNTRILDSTGDVGAFPGITIDPSGNAVIAYKDATSDRVKIAHCNDAACSTPTLTTIASSSSIGSYKIDVVLGLDNLPRILYVRSDANMFHIRCTNVSCSTNVVSQVSGISRGVFARLAMGLDGNSKIAFYNIDTSGRPYYAQCHNINCSSASQAEVEAANGYGYYMNIAIGTDGLGRLAYQDAVNEDLKFVRCTNASCSTKTITSVDTVGSVGSYISMLLDRNDFARIAYMSDTPNFDLKYAQCLDMTCATKTMNLLDTQDAVGYTTDMALGVDEFPRITYYDYTNHDLKFAQCTSMACDGTYEPSNLLVNTSDLGAQNGDVLPNTLKNTSVVFSAIHHDHEGESANKYQLQVATDTAFTAVVYDSGASGTSMTTTAVNVRSPDFTPTGFTPTPGTTYYWRIKFWDTSDTAGPYPTTYSRFRVQQTPTISSVDTANDVGIYSTTKVASDGFARIAYYDSFNQDLKYTQCTNADCSTKNTRTLDSTGDVGAYLDMVLDVSGNAYISYKDATNDRVKIARCNDAACSSPTLTTITGSSVVGFYKIPITLGLDELPRIVYSSSANNIYHIRCTNVTCSTSAHNGISGISQGVFASIATGLNGYTRIAYYNANVSGRLYYATCTSDACSSASQAEVETISSIYYPSLAIGSTDGFARIAYWDTASSDLRFIRCTNESCSTKSAVAADTTGTVGYYPSLVLDGNDFARIAYLTEVPDFDLKYMQCLNTTCTTKTTNSVDTQDAVGYLPSLALGLDEFPRISYYDYTNHDLKFAQCTSMACNNTYEPSNLLVNTSDLGAQSGDTLPNTLKNTSVVFSGIHHDHEGDSADKYRLQIATDTAFSSIVYESGATGTAMTTTSVNARSPDFTPTGFTPTPGITYYWRLKFWDTTNEEGLFTSAYSRFRVQRIPTISTVESLKDTGFASSVKVGSDGFARMAYYDSYNKDLKYSRCTNADCTTKNTVTLDGTGDVGAYLDMLLDQNGYAQISYRDATNGRVKFAKCYDSDCSNTTPPTITSIPSATSVSEYMITIGLGTDNLPRMVYRRDDLQIVHIRCTIATCATATVNTSGLSQGAFPVMRVGTDNLTRIAYYNHNIGGRVYYAVCNNVDCTSASNTQVETIGTSYYNSLALDSSNIARIAYWDPNSNDLRFVQCTNSTCSANVATAVDTVGNVGAMTNMTLGSDGFARIAYLSDTPNFDLKYMQCTTISCSTSQVTSLVDTQGVVGFYPSIAMGLDDFARISYYDYSTHDLKFAQCGNFACDSTFVPDAPTVLYINTPENTAQTGLASPANFTSPNPPVYSAIYNAGQSGEAANKYRLEISTSNANESAFISGIVYDSGAAGTSMTNTADGARSPDLTATGFTPTANTTYYFRVRFYTTSGTIGVKSTAAQYNIIANVPPTPPTIPYANTAANGAQSGLTNPLSLNSTSLVFSAIHNDPEGDAANKYQLQISTDSTFATTAYDSGASGTSMTSTANGARSPDITPTGFTPSVATNYFWRIKFWDTAGAAGAYTTGTHSFFLPGYCAPSPSDMVSWWKAEGNAADSSDGNSGTLMNGTTFGPGKIGQGFSFDGVNDYITIPDAANQTPSTNLPPLNSKITLSAWVNPSTLSGHRSIITKYSSNISQSSWYLEIADGGGLSFGVYQDSSTYRGVTTPAGTLTANTWQHVTGVFSSVDQSLTVYVNGVVQSVTVAGGTVTSIADSSAPVFIGAITPGSGVISDYWSGSIDDVRFFNRALTQTEVTNIYNEAAGTVCSANTPSTPTNLFSETSYTGAQSGQTNPTLNTISPAFSAIYTHPDDVSGNKYQLQLASDAGFNDLIYDSGSSGTNMPTVTSGARSTNLSVPITLADDTTYYWRVRFWDINEHISAYSAGSSFSTAANCILSPSDMISLWAAEGNANDSTTLNSGTLQNGATTAAGKIGQAFSLDGVNDYIHIPDDPSQTPASGKITLSAWVNPTALGSVQSIATKYTSNTSNISWYLAMTPTGKAYLATYSNGGSTSRGMTTTANVITAGTWTLVTAVYDTSNQTSAIYINGVSQPIDITGSNLTSLFDSTSPIRIGSVVTSGGNLNEFWNGKIDDVRLYNRALSAAEVSELYSSQTDGNCNHAPTAPTSLFSNTANNGAQSGLTNPTALDSEDVVFSAIHNDLDTDAANKYQLQISTNSTFTSTVYDSGAGGTTIPTIANNARSSNISIPGGTLAKGVTYYWRIKFWDTDGNAGDFSPSGTNASYFFIPGLCPLVPTDMVSWWKADGNTNDSISSNNGTLTNGATYGEGKIGNAFSFDGVDDYVSGTASNFAGINQFTMSAWVKVNAFNATQVPIRIGLAEGNGGRRLEIRTNGSVCSDYYLQGTICSSAGAMVADTWYHLSITQTATTQSVYKNGVLLISTPNTPSPIGSNDFYIGRRTNTGGVSYPVNGFVDDARVYNRAISATEVAALYNEGSGNTCNNIPAAPTAPYSSIAANGAQSGQTNPTNLTSNTLVFSAIHHDLDTDAANKYQLQISTDNTFATTNYDSGSTGINMASTADGARSPDVTTTNFTPVSGITYYWRIRFWDTVGDPGTYSVPATFTTAGYCVAPPSDMTAWWQGEGNADDTPGTNDGILTNGATYTLGKRGQAFQFDGVNDYVNLPAGGAVSSGDFTISHWIRASDFASAHVIYEQGTNGYIQTRVMPGGQFLASVDGTNLDSANTTLTANTWYLLSMTYQGSSMKLYVNDSLAGTYTRTANYLRDRAQIGSNTDVSGNPIAFFAGLIDDVRIYGRALTGGEITNLYNEGAGTPCNLAPAVASNLYSNTTTAGAQSGQTNPMNLATENLVFSAIHNDPDADAANKYQLQISTDNTFLSLVYDSGASGTSMTSTANGARSPDIAPTSFVPDRGTTYYWRIKFWDSHNVQGPFSPSGSSAASFKVVVNTGPSAPTNLYANIASIGTASGRTNPTDLTSTSIYFSAINNDLDGDNVNKYQLQISTDNTFASINYDSGAGGLALTSTADGARSPNIGTASFIPAVGTTYYWRVKFWDIYNNEGTFSPSGNDASYFFIPGTCPYIANDMVSYWSGNITTTDTVSANNGTLTNGATYAAGKVGPSFSFDGVNDYVTVPDSSSLKVGSGDFSISLWFKATSTGNHQALFSKEGSAPNFPHYGIRIDPNNKLSAFATDCGTGVCGYGTSRHGVTGNTTVTDNSWHHVVFVKNGAEQTLYLDNILDGSLSEGPWNTDSTAPLTIGSQQGLAGTFVDGRIDDIRFFNRALSAQETTDLYHSATGTLCNAHPSAPTTLYVNTASLGAQSGQTNPTDLGSTNLVFSAINNDRETGDVANKYRLQIATDNTFATPLFDNGVAGMSVLNIIAGNRSPDISPTGFVPENDTTYYWRIKFWDDTPSEGDFSAPATFGIAVNTAPTAPTNLFSNTGTAQAGLTNPTRLNSSSVFFSAIYNDADTGDTANKYQLQISTDNTFATTDYDSGTTGTNIADIVRGSRSANITATGFTPTAGITYYYRIKFWDTANEEGAFSASGSSAASFYVNTAPTAPTVLYTNTAAVGAQSGLTDPTTLDSASIVFSALHDDADLDTANKYQIQISTDNTFATTTYDSGAGGTAMATTANGVRSPDLIPSGFTPVSDTTYYWRVKFWDIHGLSGSYSPSGSSAASFKVHLNAAPTAPTTLFSNTIGAQTGQTNPTNLNSTDVVFSAVNNDPDGDNANKYELQISSNNSFSSLIYDSGSAGTAMTSTDDGARSPDITIPGGTILTAGTYYWRIKFWDTNGNIGAYSPSGSSAASFGITLNSAPSAPTNLFSNTPAATAQAGQTNPTNLDSSSIAFSAVYNDPNTGDIANKYQLQISTDNTFATTNFDSGNTGTPIADITQGNRSTDIVPAGFTASDNTTYYYRIKFWDDENAEGIFSSTAQFTTAINDAPTAPTNLLVNGAATSSNLTTTSLVFSAQNNDPDTGDIANKYQLQISTDNTFAATDFDSGAGGTSMTNTTRGTQSPSLTASGFTPNLETTYYWRIKFWDDQNTEGTFSSTASFYVHETTPPALASSTPANNTTNVNPTTNVVLAFTDAISGVNASDVNVVIGGQDAILNGTCQSGYSCSSNVITNGIEVAVNPDVDLTLSTTYTVNYSVSDLADIPNTLSGSFNFAVQAGPSSPTNLLANGETNPTALNTTDIVFSAVHNDPSAVDATKYRIQISTDSNFGTIFYDNGAGGTSFSIPVEDGERSEDISTPANFADNTTYYWRIQFWNNAGPGEFSPSNTGSASFSIHLNSAPTAPTNLFSNTASEGAQTGITNPTLDNSNLVFSAIYNDPDVTDTANKYQLQISTDNTFASTDYDSGTEVSIADIAEGTRSSDITHGSFTPADDTTYYWRIKFWDDENTEGTFSSAAIFTMNINDAPDAPTDLFSNTASNGAQTGETNPTVDTEDIVFSAVYTDLDTSDAAVKYQLQIASDAAFTSVSYDSGETTLGSSIAIGARSEDIQATGFSPLDNTTYYYRIKFWDTADTEGAFSAAATFTTNINDAPAAPTNLFANDQTDGAQTGLTNPTNLETTSPVFSAVYNDSDAGDTANKYQLQISTDGTFATTDYDSGNTGTTIVNITEGNRSTDLTPSGFTPLRDTTYYYRIKFWDASGEEGVFSANATFRIPTIIIPDTTPPVLALISPTNGQINVNVGTSLTFDVTDIESGIKDIKINSSSAVTNGICQAGYTCDVVPNGYHIIFYPAQPYSYASTVTIQITAADNAANTLNTSYSFTTQKEPIYSGPGGGYNPPAANTNTNTHGAPTTPDTQTNTNANAHVPGAMDNEFKTPSINQSFELRLNERMNILLDTMEKKEDILHDLLTTDPDGFVMRGFLAKILMQSRCADSCGALPLVPPFPDVPLTHANVIYIHVGKVAGVITGYLMDGYFRPDRLITRAEALKMIIRFYIANPPLDPALPVPFVDVHKEDWFNLYVSLGLKYGMLNASESGFYYPNEYITRKEIAQMMAKALDAISN
ncbi:MAG: LamG-like jellyroll fold domain-containing protein [Candidatus Gracilibacteria bacterium]